VSDEWLEHEVFGWASDVTGVDVSHALRRRTRDLERTSVLQPTLVALSLAVWQELALRGVRPAFVCGHSVGEVAAWAASGCVTERDAIGFAAARGGAMERAALASPGGMLAIAPDVLERALAVAGVDVAARNGPSQVVLSGPADVLVAVARTCGGTRVEVSGPWHSRAMGAASHGTAVALANISTTTAMVPIVTCLDGRVLGPEESPDFVAQLTAPVAWDRVMQTLARERITDIVCAAPGRLNRSLLRDGLGKTMKLHVADTHADIDRIARGFNG